MVVLVVQLHDLAADGRLQGAIVVCIWSATGQIDLYKAKLHKFQLTGQVRQGGLAAGKGQTRNASSFRSSRSSRAEGHAGRVGEQSSHCEHTKSGREGRSKIRKKRSFQDKEKPSRTKGKA
jgi:hypothetical protein